MTTPLEYLKSWLARHHPSYGIGDVALSTAEGYLVCLTPCPRAGKVWWCRTEPHYHTINIQHLRHGHRNRKGHLVSPYKFWRELHGVLPVARHTNCLVPPVIVGRGAP